MKWTWLWICTTFCMTTLTKATHTEEVRLRPLPKSSNVLAHFRFITTEFDQQHHLYPKIIRQILTKYDAASIHISFAVGTFTNIHYGPPHPIEQMDASDLHAPFGTRLQVELYSHSTNSTQSVMDRWKGITSELGAVFSASLNQMDETTIASVLSSSSRAQWGAIESSPSSTMFFQASLAREELCTENITPWIKMLPCRSHAGLGALVDPIKLLSGEYLSLSLRATRSIESGEWKLEHHLTTVQVIPHDEKETWNLARVFYYTPNNQPQEKIKACPLAITSRIITELPSSSSFVYVVSSSADYQSRVVSTDLRKTEVNVATQWMKYGDQQIPSYNSSLHVHRFLTGHGQVHGGLAVRLENTHPTCKMQVEYQDVIPWYLRIYFHTFTSTSNKLLQDPATSSLIEFEPAELRGRPNQFHVTVTLPPHSVLLFSLQFDKVFVRLSEHPPDANRGFDLPPSVVTWNSSITTACPMTITKQVLYLEPLLVALPTPDFSMPYNVITLTSTVVAFFVGSMLNTLLRKAPRIQRLLDDKTIRHK